MLHWTFPCSISLYSGAIRLAGQAYSSLTKGSYGSPLKRGGFGRFSAPPKPPAFTSNVQRHKSSFPRKREPRVFPDSVRIPKTAL